jgi:hypothetical protein
MPLAWITEERQHRVADVLVDVAVLQAIFDIRQVVEQTGQFDSDRRSSR